MNIVIIGLGTAGFAAALEIKKKDRKANITIIDKKDYLLHSCGLPFVFEGKVKIEDLKHKIKGMFNIKADSEATNIDFKNKEVEYKNLKSNRKEKIKYDRLIIATGSFPFVPKIEGIKNKNVFTIHILEDIKKLKSALKNAKNIAIIGAGAIGLETAISLRKLNVTIIEMLSCLLPKAIDEDISKILEEHLIKKGVKIILNKKLDKIKNKKIILDDKEINADVVIIATGVKPNLELIRNSDIKVGEFGILVNEKMETKIKDVYAAGDCIENYSLINKTNYPAFLANVAYKQGTIAGTNALGGNLHYDGSLTTFASYIGIEIAATGFNSYFAKEYGYNIVIGKAKSKTKPEWYPNGKEITVKIIADSKTKKILGCQAIGDGAASRVNVVSAAIKAGFTLKDLSDIELAYCPAISQSYDVLQQAADIAIRKLNQK